MAEHKDQTLTGKVTLDGGVFTDIVFRDAVLIYSGGTPPSFTRCEFDRANFTLEGPAAATAMFLNMMAPATTNLREVVFGLLPALAE